MTADIEALLWNYCALHVCSVLPRCSSGESAQVIFPSEAESFVQSLKTFSIEDIGGIA